MQASGWLRLWCAFGILYNRHPTVIVIGAHLEWHTSAFLTIWWRRMMNRTLSAWCQHLILANLYGKFRRQADWLPTCPQTFAEFLDDNVTVSKQLHIKFRCFRGSRLINTCGTWSGSESENKQNICTYDFPKQASKLFNTQNDGLIKKLLSATLS